MRLSCLVVLGAALAAALPPAEGFAQSTAFDGTWSGTGTLIARRGRGNSCGPETTDRRFTIQNGQISFDYDRRYGVNFTGPIAADGSFSIASGNDTFMGRANGRTMTATYSGRACERSFEFHRRAN